MKELNLGNRTKLESQKILTFKKYPPLEKFRKILKFWDPNSEFSELLTHHSKLLTRVAVFSSEC